VAEQSCKPCLSIHDVVVYQDTFSLPAAPTRGCTRGTSYPGPVGAEAWES